MAITVPKDGDIISASTFGKPVADAINAMQLAMGARMGGTWHRVATQSFANGAGALVSWDTEIEDTNSFATPPFTTLTVPAGCAGVYLISASVYFAHESGTVTVNGPQGMGSPSGRGNPTNAWATVSFGCRFAVGNTFSISGWQLSGAAQNAQGFLSFYRISL